MARPSISITARCLSVLIQADTPLRVTDISRKLNKPSNYVRTILLRLEDRGHIRHECTAAGCNLYFYSSQSSGPHIWDITATWHFSK